MKLALLHTGNVGIGITTPFTTLSLGTPATRCDATLTLSKNTGTGWHNFKFEHDANFDFVMGDFGGYVGGNAWTSNQSSIII